MKYFIFRPEKFIDQILKMRVHKSQMGVMMMAARPANTFWNILYIVLVIFVILALLQLLGVFAFTSAVASIIYTLAVIFIIVAVLHLLGLF